MALEEQHERQRLARLYEALDDDALLAIAGDWDSLTEVAQDAIEDELERRGLDEELERLLDDPSLTLPGVSDGRMNREQNGFVTEHRPLVTIRNFGDLHEALLAKGMFDAAGIECFLVDDNMVRLDWLISNILGGVKLAVRAEDLGAATELLTDPTPVGFRVEGVGLYEQPACPGCGLQNVKMLETGVNHDGALWQCRACGHQWESV
jgi:hypothetical protein